MAKCMRVRSSALIITTILTNSISPSQGQVGKQN